MSTVRDRKMKLRGDTRNVRVIAAETETEFVKENSTVPPWISVQRQKDEISEKRDQPSRFWTSKVKSGARPAIPSSTKKIWNYGTVSASVKNKQTISRLTLSEKKSNDPGSEVRGRRLFPEAKQRSNIKKVNSMSKSSVIVSKPDPQNEVNSISKSSAKVSKPEPQDEEEEPVSDPLKAVTFNEVEETVSSLSKSIICTEEETLQSRDINDTGCSDFTEKGVSPYTEKDLQSYVSGGDNLSEVTKDIEGGPILKEDKNSSSQEISPPVSALLRELSSNMKLFSQEKSSQMKSILSSTPLCITMAQASPLCIVMPQASPLCITTHQASTNNMEPNNPVPEQNLRRGVSNISMPQACTDMAEPKNPVHEQSLRRGVSNIAMPQACTYMVEPKTPVPVKSLGWGVSNITTPQSSFKSNTGLKDSLVKEHLKFLNSANKEELKRLKGIGEKRAEYIVRLREDSPEYFKELDDLKDIGLSAKQIKGMMKKAVGDLLFS